MKLKSLLYGMVTYVPGVTKLRRRRTGGTDSARYCYSVWLRHLVMAKKNGLNPHPQNIAELGPGDSLGIGLAALLSGSARYFALDVVKYTNVEKNIEIFEELITLFKNRTPIPGEDEFPKVKPFLDSYDFPSDILDENRLLNALKDSRIERIRDAVKNMGNKDPLINYIVPWDEVSVLERNTFDIIFSQAVLEHVNNLRQSYRAMYVWLKPNGYISHQIDFKCHGTADEWNGHWAYSEFIWKLIKGKRSYLINREPYSTHISLLEQEGFEIICAKKIKSESRLYIDDLAPKFQSITREDLNTSGVFIQALKKTSM